MIPSRVLTLGGCWLGIVIALTTSMARAAIPSGTPISPFLTGQNFWFNPPDTAYAVIGAGGVTMMRIGGHAYDDAPLSDAALLKQVDNIRSIGAEPLVQVSRHKGGAVAAATVRFLTSMEGQPSAILRLWLRPLRP